MNAVCNGGKFRVNFPKRELVVNGKFLIKEGKYEGELGNEAFSFEGLERLYERYKHSLPSERSESRYRRYFKALCEDDLTDEDMMFGVEREEAQAELEMYVLCALVDGSLKWDDGTMGTWFWQSEADRDLIILKSWVESPEK